MRRRCVSRVSALAESSAPGHAAHRTIYDMTCWLMPELHVSANVNATRRTERGCCGVRKPVSRSPNRVSRTLSRYSKLPADRIEVIYPGVAEEFFTVDRPQAQARCEAAQAG